MTTIGGYWANPHRSQYDPGSSAITRTAGCTWTTGSNGANAVTGGAMNLTPDQVKKLVLPSEETSPTTPGWSLPDLRLAMSRAKVPFEDRTGQGWQAVVNAHRAGLYVAVQGDSDQFGNETCSGQFDGDHCVGIHPATAIVEGVEYWRIDDPICPRARWERPDVLQKYAQKLLVTVRWGAFLTPVPKPVAPPAKYRVHIDADQPPAVPVYDKPYGKVIGHIRHATYICTRTRTRPGLRWWYRVIGTASGAPTNIAGRYLPAEPKPPMSVALINPPGA